MGIFQNILNWSSDRQERRLDARNERQGNRVGARETKWDAYGTAYANGIDPRASMWQGISGITQGLGQTASNIWGFGSMPGKNGPGQSPLGAIDGKTIGIFALIGLALMLLMGGKR